MALDTLLDFTGTGLRIYFLIGIDKNDFWESLFQIRNFEIKNSIS